MRCDCEKQIVFSSLCHFFYLGGISGGGRHLIQVPFQDAIDAASNKSIQILNSKNSKFRSGGLFDFIAQHERQTGIIYNLICNVCNKAYITCNEVKVLFKILTYSSMPFFDFCFFMRELFKQDKQELVIRVASYANGKCSRIFDIDNKDYIEKLNINLFK